MTTEYIDNDVCIKFNKTGKAAQLHAYSIVRFESMPHHYIPINHHWVGHCDIYVRFEFNDKSLYMKTIPSGKGESMCQPLFLGC